MDISQPLWTTADYVVASEVTSPTDAVIERAYERTFRSTFSAPGFCLIDLGEGVSSTGLRRLMLNLKLGLQSRHREQDRREIVFVSAARFDQQVTTRPHRDGGPDESCLMLGYEPSLVKSTISLLDYSRCARGLGITPAEFLAQHNPMFGDGEELLRDFTTTLPEFSSEHSYVLLINNSVAEFRPETSAWQGVLHTAEIVNPSDDLRRVINSTMFASVPFGTPEILKNAELEDFLSTDSVRRRSYDRPQLDDDRPADASEKSVA
jgi:hypothetical protein